VEDDGIESGATDGSSSSSTPQASKTDLLASIHSPRVSRSPTTQKGNGDDYRTHTHAQSHHYIHHIPSVDSDTDGNDGLDYRLFGSSKPHPFKQMKTYVGILMNIPVYVCLTFALSALYFVVTGVQFWGTAYLQSSLGGTQVRMDEERRTEGWSEATAAYHPPL